MDSVPRGCDGIHDCVVGEPPGHSHAALTYPSTTCPIEPIRCDDVDVSKSVVLGLVLVLCLVACGSDDGEPGGSSAITTITEAGAADTIARQGTAPATTSVAPAAPTTAPPAAAPDVDISEPALRDELLAMMDEDQAEQLGEVATDNYAGRTARLTEILDEYGWPGFDMVGPDGSTAAWVVAQHADLDPDVQRLALDLLRAAAEAGQASRGDLAYLEDRVAVAAGDEQVYGTQMRCDEQGEPAPATPITDAARLDERREAAGLAPFDEYLAVMREVCSGAT